jgi:hypothetical protein
LAGNKGLPAVRAWRLLVRSWHGEAQGRAGARLDAARVGPAVVALELGAQLLLLDRHASLAAQLGEGEGVAVVRARAEDEVEVERVELAIGEALEAVDHDRLVDRATRAVAPEPEQGVAAEPGGVAADGAG